MSCRPIEITVEQKLPLLIKQIVSSFLFLKSFFFFRERGRGVWIPGKSQGEIVIFSWKSIFPAKFFFEINSLKWRKS